MLFRRLFRPLQNPFVRNIALAAIIAAMSASILFPGMASAAGISVGADESAQVGDVKCLTAHATEANHAPHSGGAEILAAASHRPCASHLLRTSANASPQVRPITRPPGHGDIP